MAFVEIDSFLAEILEEGASRKMNIGGDARITIGDEAAVGPCVYYTEVDETAGTMLKIWNEPTTGVSRYEYSDNLTTPQADAETWLESAGGNVTTMLTFAPSVG